MCTAETGETGADRPVSTGPDAGWRVTLGVVLHGSSHVTPQLRQIGRQLQHPVDGADEHLTCPPVDGQVGEGVVERAVHRPARSHRGRGRDSRGGDEWGGEEEEGEKEEEREKRTGRREHGGESEEEERTEG